jgi:preprotein translocase subunit SecA
MAEKYLLNALDAFRVQLPFASKWRGNPPYGTEFLSHVRRRGSELAAVGDSEVRRVAETLRVRVAKEGPDQASVQVEAFAVMCEALRRVHGLQLYDVQLMAAAVLSRGNVAEMQTGEGKTLTCAPAAFLHGLTGRGVHVATPNAYLAERDFQLLAPAYQMLGVSVGLLTDDASRDAKRAAYLCDVTYGTGYEFGFDYLRDQLVCRQRTARPLGQTLWAKMRAAPATEPHDTIQRRLYYAIVDEVDNVLLDDASSPLVLSGPSDGEAADAAAHRSARRMLRDLICDQHFHLDASTGSVQLTEAGMERIHADDVQIPLSVLLRTWAEYVEVALRAEYLLRRDVHYVVAKNVVQIVDASTGRIFADRTWQDGLHQAVEAKEDAPITAQRYALAQITRQRYYRLYERLAGMTGTAAGCEREFRQVYRLPVQVIPLRLPSRRVVLPTRFFTTAQAKWEAIGQSVVQVHAALRPVLVGTRSILDSEALAERLRQQGLSCQLLNGRQDAAEAAIIAQAGQPNAITIATNLAGRGTDIQLDRDVARRGGLHVILAECHESARIDRQLLGRCARQGDPGSVQTFVSADDSLLQRYGPWFADSIRRQGGAHGELLADLTRPLRRLQRTAERQAYAGRCALLRRDLARDELLSGHEANK